jgi:hypothetical protein
MNFGHLNDFLEFKLNKEIGKGFSGDWASFLPTTHGLTGLRPAWSSKSPWPQAGTQPA